MPAIHTHLGRILAIVDHALAGLPAGAVNNCLTMPKTALMGQQAIRAQPSISAQQWLDERMGDACNAIDMVEYEALVEPVPPAAQGDMLIAYHRERAALSDLAETRKAGRSGHRHAAVDWDAVDWTNSDAELARQTGVSRQAVRAARMRRSAPAE